MVNKVGRPVVDNPKSNADKSNDYRAKLKAGGREVLRVTVDSSVVGLIDDMVNSYEKIGLSSSRELILSGAVRAFYDDLVV